MRKLIASDFDGTITSNDDEIERYNKVAIRKWREAGNLFGAVTGRSITSIKHEMGCRKIDADFFIASTGAYIVCGDEVIHSAFVSGEIIPELVDYAFESGGFGFHFCSDDRDYMPGWELIEDAKSKGITSWESGFAEIVPPEIRNLERFLQFTVYYDKPEDEQMAALEEMNRRFKGRMIGYPMVDCVKYGTNKAVGIGHVMKHYGIPYDSCFAVGDYYNDIPMLEAYHGFTVDSAPDSVKKTAERVARSLGDAIDLLLSE